MDNLLINHEELMKEYYYEKNTMYELNKISLGSSKKIWWKCIHCGHIWQTSVKNRVGHDVSKGTGCPKCALKLINSNKINSLINKKGSLGKNRPDLLKEWNFAKNKDIDPFKVLCGSSKKVWWKCELGHEWMARICNRTNGSNCIYCAGQKAITGINDFATKFPELLAEWDYDKNKDLNPYEFKTKSNVKVWWKCELGHSWNSTISHRVSGTGCPHCYSENSTSFPEQAICYYLSKYIEIENRFIINGQEIDIYIPSLKIGFEYDGSYFHNSEQSKIKEQKKDLIIKSNNITLYRIKESEQEYFDKENKRIYCKIDREYKYLLNILKYIGEIVGCTFNELDISNDRTKIYKNYIKSIKKKNFTIKCPHLISEWDYNKNINLSPEMFTIGSNKKVWWICKKCNSSYECSISHKVEGNNCPYCAGKKVNHTNNLQIKFPELSKYWNYNKNKVTPDNIYFNSRKTVWWICPQCNKDFEAPVCSRVRSKHYLCKECMHKFIGNKNQLLSIKNGSLLDNNPVLAKEWNYEKNGELTPDKVSCNSGTNVWWKCNICGHEWNARIMNRTLGTGCPNCYKNKHKNKCS